MKLLATKKIFTDGQEPVKSFTVPAHRGRATGLNQGLLLNEIFSAASASIGKLVDNYSYAAALSISRQILFFAQVLPGDYIAVQVKAVRRIRNIKITVELYRTRLPADELVATGKFVYEVK